jgi:hypothetical protein
MFDLTNFSLRDMTECGAALRKLGSSARSFEAVADRIVRYLYDQCADERTGEKSCVLVRFFKTHPFHSLDPELRELARRSLGSIPERPEMKCLTLLATAGLQPQWNARRQSAGHQVIPLASPEMVIRYPMISQLVQQFGLEVSAVVHPAPELLVDLHQRTFNVFHVEQAVGSTFVPAQNEFVIPFGVQSVLGFGGMLPSGNLYVVILFSRVHIPRQTADLFKALSLSVKAALLPLSESTAFA